MGENGLSYPVEERSSTRSKKGKGMDEREALEIEIGKTEQILTESKAYYDKNPEDYSARLLLMSTENYLQDLLRRLDLALQEEKRSR